MFAQIILVLILTAEVIHAQAQEAATPLRQKRQFTTGPLSACCLLINANCVRRKMECVDFIKPPQLIKNCRCAVTIRQEYERFRQQCMREALQLALERIERQKTREILRLQPGQSGRFPGLSPEVGSKGPAGRGNVVLSEEYIKQKKLQKTLAEQVTETSTSTTEATVTSTTFGYYDEFGNIYMKA